MKASQNLIINILIEIEDIFTRSFFSKFKSTKDRIRILKNNLDA